MSSGDNDHVDACLGIMRLHSTGSLHAAWVRTEQIIYAHTHVPTNALRQVADMSEIS